jgi:hypothetical protein
MDTEMNERLRADPERNRAISERIPASRWGAAEDTDDFRSFFRPGEPRTRFFLHSLFRQQ